MTSHVNESSSRAARPVAKTLQMRWPITMGGGKTGVNLIKHSKHQTQTYTCIHAATDSVQMWLQQMKSYDFSLVFQYWVEVEASL